MVETPPMEIINEPTQREPIRIRPNVTFMKDVNDSVRDLLQPKPLIYWGDLGFSAFLGWLSFFMLTQATTLFSQVCFYLLAVLALYRGLFFIHELSHIDDRELPGFRLAWNLIVGIPMMIPSVLYETIHLDHHKRPKYGTLADPEYMPLGAGSKLGIVMFLAKSIAFPIVFAIRFWILAPIGFLLPKFHRFLESHLSALVINESYRRDNITETERARIYALEFAILVLWSVIFGLFALGYIPKSFFLNWYLVIFGVAIVNQSRTLVAHRYKNIGNELSYEGQFSDSINVEGGFWTEFWAPVGARFHALHHFVPKLPYHNLPKAHKRLTTQSHIDMTLYNASTEKNFKTALEKLWRDALVLAFVLGAGALPGVASASVDPCKSIIERQYNIDSNSLSEKKAEEVGLEPNLYGRFFSNSERVFWTLPFADGKACVVREALDNTLKL